MAPGQFTKLSKFVMWWQKSSSESITARQENLLLQTRLCFQVHWFQQQHEKKRKKRDFGAASYAFADYSPFFDFGPRPRQATLFHRQRNRGLPLQNLFTDPLFKEQWYLVSTDFNCTDLRDRIRDGNRTNCAKCWSRSTFPIISSLFLRRIYRWCQLAKVYIIFSYFFSLWKRNIHVISYYIVRVN